METESPNVHQTQTTQRECTFWDNVTVGDNTQGISLMAQALASRIRLPLKAARKKILELSDNQEVCNFYIGFFSFLFFEVCLIHNVMYEYISNY